MILQDCFLTVQSEILPDDPDSCHFFGRKILLSKNGHQAFIAGSQSLNNEQLYRSVLFVFRHIGQGWKQESILTSSTQNVQTFGRSITCTSDGKRLAVGSSVVFDSEISRTIEIFEAPNWELKQLIQPPDNLPTGFGSNIRFSSDGEWLFISEPKYTSDTHTWIGRVHAYKYDGTLYRPIDTIMPEVEDSYRCFGTNLVVSGYPYKLVVNSHFYQRKTQQFSGSVEIIELQNDRWVNIATIYPQHMKQTHLFGSHIAISEDGACIAISAKRYDPVYALQGCVYIYKKKQEYWIESEELVNFDTPLGFHYGDSIAMANRKRRVMIGAKDHHQQSGAVYLYQEKDDRWIRTLKMVSLNHYGDNFGHKVAYADQMNLVLIGAPRARTSKGTVYFTHLSF